MFLIKPDKKKLGKCCAYRCNKKHAKRDRFCHRHRHLFRKFNDPEAYTFYSLQSNAKRRGKDFTLTLVEFRLFCKETNYIVLKGKSRYSASIDRRDNTKGYSYDNIRCISLNENSSKNCYEDVEPPPF